MRRAIFAMALADQTLWPLAPRSLIWGKIPHGAIWSVPAGFENALANSSCVPFPRRNSCACRRPRRLTRLSTAKSSTTPWLPRQRRVAEISSTQPLHRCVFLLWPLSYSPAGRRDRPRCREPGYCGCGTIDAAQTLAPWHRGGPWNPGSC